MEMLWRGTVAFGLVQIPILLYKATRERRLPFRLLHEKDLSPIRYLKVCTAEDRPVPNEEIVRGLDVDGEWVTLTEQEMALAAPALTRTIEIREFVSLHEIDPILFRKPYYLAPDEGGEEMYVMLREAIRRSDRVGVAELVLLHREHLAVVSVHGEALVLETLHYPEELIEERELQLPAQTRLREGEIRMAVELIGNLSEPFDASKYRNEHRTRLLQMVRRKAKGDLPPALEVVPEPEPTKVIDLTRRLQESLERIQQERRTA